MVRSIVFFEEVRGEKSINNGLNQLFLFSPQKCQFSYQYMESDTHLHLHIMIANFIKNLGIELQVPKECPETSVPKAYKFLSEIQINICIINDCINLLYCSGT